MVKLEEIPEIEEAVFFDSSVCNTVFFKRTYDTRHISDIDLSLINGVMCLQKDISSVLSFDSTFVIKSFEDDYKKFLGMISEKLEYYTIGISNILKSRKKDNIPEQFHLYNELVSVVEQNLREIPKRVYKSKDGDLFWAYIYKLNKLTRTKNGFMHLSKNNKALVATAMTYCDENKKTPTIVSKNNNILNLVKAIKDEGFCTFKFYYTEKGPYEQH